MNKDNINTAAHRWLDSYLKPEHICIDATCGNGNDTLFLAKRCKKVYGFDIQHQAIENTKKRCAEMNNFQLFEMSHDLMETVIQEPVDCAVFNFGYLPKADPSIITLPHTSIKAVQAAWNLLKTGGILVLCCYVGHPGGQEETDQIHDWITKQKAELMLTYRQDRPLSPLLTILKKDA